MITGRQSRRRACGRPRWSVEALILAAFFCIRFASAAAPIPTESDGNLLVDENVLIKMHDGGTLSTTTVRPEDSKPLPTLFTLDIYTDPDRFREAGRHIATRGRRVTDMSRKERR